MAIVCLKFELQLSCEFIIHVYKLALQLYCFERERKSKERDGHTGIGDCLVTVITTYRQNLVTISQLHLNE